MRPAGMKLVRIMLLGAILLPLATTAQVVDGSTDGSRPGCDNMKARGRPAGARMFDPDTVTTIQGEILEVERHASGRGHEGVHLIVAVGSEKVSVRLGPDFYVARQALKLAKGDMIEVRGSRISVGAESAIIAQEVRRGADVLALRDASGVPLWRGQGMHSR
jgi:hypothetical protein